MLVSAAQQSESAVCVHMDHPSKACLPPPFSRIFWGRFYSIHPTTIFPHFLPGWLCPFSYDSNSCIIFTCNCYFLSCQWAVDHHLSQVLKSFIYALSVWLFLTPWTIACQASLSMEYSKQEHRSGLPFPTPRDLPNPEIEPRTPTLQADSLLSEPPGNPYVLRTLWLIPTTAVYVKYLLQVNSLPLHHLGSLLFLCKI